MAHPIAPTSLRFWHGLQGLGLALAGMFGFVLLWQLIESMGIGVSTETALTIQTIGISGAFWAGAMYGVAKTCNPIKTTLSARMPHPLFWVIAIVGVLFAGALCDEVVSLLHRFKPTFFDMGAMAEISGLMSSIPLFSFVLLAMAISVFPALGEEFMFRGLVLRSFQRDMPTHLAVIYSSVLFGAVHLSWLQGTAAALLGIYLAGIVLLSGSIYPAIVAHFVNNLSWCLIARYEPEFMKAVLSKGHSWLTIAVCVVVVAGSVVAMGRIKRGRGFR